MSRLYVLISGFGEPHWDEKVRILRSNLHRIRAGPWAHVDIDLCVYTQGRSLPPDITQYVTLHTAPGIVGQFLLRHADPARLQDKYDYVLLLLDDVELQPDIDWTEMMSLKSDLGLDIVAPALTVDSAFSYEYIRHQPQNQYTLAVTRFLEYFCFFMDVGALKRYYRLLREDNPWVWGVDLVLVKHGKLRCGVLNTMTVKHYYKGESYAFVPGADPRGDLVRYLAHYGETPESVLSRVRPVQYVVVKI